MLLLVHFENFREVDLYVKSPLVNNKDTKLFSVKHGSLAWLGYLNPDDIFPLKKFLFFCFYF